MESKASSRRLSCGLAVLWLAATGSAFGGILAGPVINPANGHAYYLLTQNTWTGASLEARQMGGYLATVNDKPENDWITATFGNYGGAGRHLWIGLLDAEQEATFRWSTGEPVTFANWALGEPNDASGEDYAELLGADGLQTVGLAGQWNDLPDAPGYPVFGVVELEPPAPSSNLIVNGSFEFPYLTSDANHVVPASDLAPWQTTEGALLVWVPSLPNESAADGRQHVEVVTLWQTVPTIAGEDYRLSFQHAARPGVDSVLSVSINGEVIRTFAENGSALTGFKWQRFGTNFTATGSTLTIRFDGSGVAGNAHVDAVTLERLPVSSAIRVSEIEVCFPTVATKLYQPQFRPSVSNVWLNLGVLIQGNGTTNCIKDTVPAGEPQRFYRVTTVP